MGGRLSLGGLCIFSIAEFLVHFLREQIFTGDFWHLWRLHKPCFWALSTTPVHQTHVRFFAIWTPVYREWSSRVIILWSCYATYKWGHGRPINAISYQQKIITAWVTLQVQEVPIPKKVETALHSTSQTNIQGLTFLTFGDVKSFLCWSRYASCTASFAWPWRWMEHLNRWHTRPPGNCVHGKASRAKVQGSTKSWLRGHLSLFFGPQRKRERERDVYV